MNYIISLDAHYLRSSRTVELILLTSIVETIIKQKALYVFNYEGVHYRVFETAGAVFDFFQGNDYGVIAEFDNETELDNYLALEYEIN